MSLVFTTDELNLLRVLVKGHKALSEKLANVEAGIHYQADAKSIKDDVLAALEKGGYDDVSEADLERIISRVSNHDETMMNLMINATISNVLNGE